MLYYKRTLKKCRKAAEQEVTYDKSDNKKNGGFGASCRNDLCRNYDN